MDTKEIFDREYNRIYRIALLYLKNSADAEDAAQTIFLKYLEKNISFKNEEHEKAWFITAAKNHCKDILKSFWNKNVELGEIPEQKNENEGKELISLVLKLPDKYSEVLYLYYYEGYKAKEISKIMSIKESTVQTRLYDGRKKLKEILEKEGL
jgi:RNA polymerase sigma-70 factor (ECF subfamily)